ncbi:MAG: hypothetical protein ACTHNG_03685 [Ginsengibacter sp.]|jgi:hypothetical protein
MKKIITVLRPIDSPWPAMRISTFIAKKNSAAIHLVFLSTSSEDVDYNYPFPNDLSTVDDFTGDQQISESNQGLIEDKLELFKQECQSGGIDLSFEKNISIEEFCSKTEDADLLVANETADFLPDVLHDIQCPAFLAAFDHLPERSVLMFNNSENSKLAIESFSALLNVFTNLPSILLSINPKEETAVEDYANQLQGRFPDISTKFLQGKVKKEMEHFLSELPGHILVVMGAFDRSEISEFFHESLAKTVIRDKKYSLFIAHK